MTGQYLRVLNILKDSAIDGRLYFCSRSLCFSVFSNFHMEPLEIGGELWPSGEHYYQAAKFAERSPYADMRTFREIREARTPGEAKQLADARLQETAPLPAEYRVTVMNTMLRAKFTPGTRMHRLLLQTGDLDLIHLSPDDSFWGQTRSGTGENLLGQMLMQIRRGGPDSAHNLFSKKKDRKTEIGVSFAKGSPLILANRTNEGNK